MTLQCFKQNVQHSIQKFKVYQEMRPNDPRGKNIQYKPACNLAIKVIIHEF